MHLYYFSDRERGERPRNQEMIGETVWSGIYEHVKAAHNNSSSFWRLAISEIPEIDGYIYLDSYVGIYRERFIDDSGNTLSTLAILDLIEFSYRKRSTNDQRSFRTVINRIFARNGLAYELSYDGKIVRLPSQVLLDALKQSEFATGDDTLDDLLWNARNKFFDPDESVRQEALEKLWDAFERLKTIEPVGDEDDKKVKSTALLTRMADSPKLREALAVEFKQLTKIGNEFHIRHWETDKERIQSSKHVDYLFHRLFALIRLALQMTDRGG